MFPQRPPAPSPELIDMYLHRAIEVAREAKAQGKHPFGSVLIGPDGEELLSQGNLDTLNHAETTLCRTAWAIHKPEFLWKCTLYTNFEPCCMCAGSCYWANIGRVVYGLPESELLAITGDDAENMTMNLSCREVFESGQKDVEVFGPYPEYRDEILEDHKSFWQH